MRDSFRNRGGLMGMLGGLALGGLLGAMLFGGGFEHINLFDIVVLGLATYLLYWFFAARRRSQWGAETGPGRPQFPAMPAQSDQQRPQQRDEHRSTAARFDTNLLFRDSRSAGLVTSESGASSASAKPLPLGFDAGAFLEGAKNAYRHLQQAWDEGDLAELRALTTQPVFDELRQQLLDAATTERTDVMSLDAALLEVRHETSSTQASVMFDARVRESVGSATLRVREVWHFVRNSDSKQPTWFLDGIQQVDG